MTDAMATESLAAPMTNGQRALLLLRLWDAAEGVPTSQAMRREVAVLLARHGRPGGESLDELEAVRRLLRYSAEARHPEDLVGSAPWGENFCA
jgi:hypothetical protein